MRLFVWDDVLTDYTSGMVVALAESVDQAREIAYKDPFICPGELDAEPEVFDLDKPVYFSCHGGG